MPVRPLSSPGQPPPGGGPALPPHSDPSRPHPAAWRQAPGRLIAWLRRPQALGFGPRSLPGSLQRRRCLLAVLLALVALIARPLPPFLWLPGWCVGALLLWAVAELTLWLWRPHRWR